MGRRFTRRKEDREAAVGGDAALVAAALDESVATFGPDPSDFDLAVAIGDLLDRAPTDDLRALRLEGVDERDLYERELRPNWEGLSKGERAAKIESFARLAHSLSDEPAGGMAAIVRTKAIVLAWAYDRTHGGQMLPRVARGREPLGPLEVAPAG